MYRQSHHWLKWPEAGMLFCYEGCRWRINACIDDAFKCEVVGKCSGKIRRHAVGEIKTFRSWEMAPIALRQWHRVVVLRERPVR
jgi:hypothetical protein